MVHAPTARRDSIEYAIPMQNTSIHFLRREMQLFRKKILTLLGAKVIAFKYPTHRKT